MNEKPILFSGEMVRAILEGRKTQTRRVIRDVEKLNGLMMDGEAAEWCPYGAPGDRLWVRETCYLPRTGGTDEEGEWQGYTIKDKQLVQYAATDEPVTRNWIYKRQKYCLRKYPSIHMPRWASRITLEVVKVRVERVQDISVRDVVAEGCDIPAGSLKEYARDVFIRLWDSINAKRGYGWDKNPWVWVIEFKQVTA